MPFCTFGIIDAMMRDIMDIFSEIIIGACLEADVFWWGASSTYTGFSSVLNYSRSIIAAVNTSFLYRNYRVFLVFLNIINCFCYFGIKFSFCFQITQLKIDNNPFAKGFRDTGAGKREKK